MMISRSTLSYAWTRMTELDQVWNAMLADAALNAEATGRSDVAEYLRLKATNDAIRARAVVWLLDTFADAGSEAMRTHPHLIIDRQEPHSFRRENSTMVG